MDPASLVLGICIGLVIGYALWVYRSSGEQPTANTGNMEQLIAEKARFEALAAQLQENISKLQEDATKMRTENQDLIRQHSEGQSTIKHLEQTLTSQKEEIQEMQKKLSTEFENLANRIFEEKTQKFTHQNKENLGELLKPFADRIRTFEETMRTSQLETVKERTSLTEQIKQLTSLNNQMREDAQNLTKALKGDNKAQGNWGELILERILEASGLIRDREYFTQVTDHNVEGQLVRPDVVIKLPDDKHLIIDSKVSLIAYEAYTNEEDPDQGAVHLKDHVLSVKKHIKDLSDKNYQSSAKLHTPEFVLLFMPIESSFSLAIKADNEIYQYAWERKVVIVSPSTLLATLKTIASVWKQERQTRNALEIARQAGALYDKFVGFIEDMEKIEVNLQRSQKSYDEAMKKLRHGSGNLVKKTEDLKKLGAKASKTIPGKYLDDDIDQLSEGA